MVVVLGNLCKDTEYIASGLDSLWWAGCCFHWHSSSFVLLAKTVKGFLKSSKNKSNSIFHLFQSIALEHLNQLDLQLQNLHVNTSSDQLIHNRF